MVVVLLSLVRLQRAEEFSDPESLWRATLVVNPRSFAAHNNLGLDFQERGHEARNPDAGRGRTLPRGVELSTTKLESAGVNLANVLRMEGRWKASADLYRQVLDA